MRRYKQTVKADERSLMRPPALQSVTQISKELDIYLATLYACRKAWRLQGEMVPKSEKVPEGLDEC